MLNEPGLTQHRQRGASADLRVEYANNLDTPIHERTCAHCIKLRRLRKAYVRRKFTPHKADFYVVYVSRTWMGLGVGYVHVTGIEPAYVRE